jgi:hypothetical protein
MTTHFTNDQIGLIVAGGIAGVVVLGLIVTNVFSTNDDEDRAIRRQKRVTATSIAASKANTDRIDGTGQYAEAEGVTRKRKISKKSHTKSKKRK